MNKNTNVSYKSAIKEEMEKRYNHFLNSLFLNKKNNDIDFYLDEEATFLYSSESKTNHIRKDLKRILNALFTAYHPDTEENLRKVIRCNNENSFIIISEFIKHSNSDHKTTIEKKNILSTYWDKSAEDYRIKHITVSEYDLRTKGNGEDGTVFDKNKDKHILTNKTNMYSYSQNKASKRKDNNENIHYSSETNTANMQSNNDEWNANLNLNVLLVDDKSVNLKIIGLMLEAANCRVDTASNGKEALSAYDPEKHQLILMDIMMPVMDGITSMKELRKLHKSKEIMPPIIAITANAMRGDKEKYKNEGFDAYIAKPVTMGKLVQELKDLKIVKP